MHDLQNSDEVDRIYSHVRIAMCCAQSTAMQACIFHGVHLNFAKCIKLCIENDGNHVEMLFVHIRTELNCCILKCMCF